MDEITVSLRTDTATLQALRAIAREEGCTPSDIVRVAIRRDLYRRSRAKKAVRADERLVAPLRALLADDFAYATGWNDLRDRLAAKGYGIQESGAGIAVFELSSGRRAAKASDLGTSYGRLMRRFDAPMPGHSHAYLFDRLVRR